MLSTGFQLASAGAACGITGSRIFKSDHPAYPTTTGDGGAVPLIFVVGVLGIIPVIVGLCSLGKYFTRCANRGHERRFCRYTSICTDTIFLFLVGAALAVSKDHTLPQIITPFLLLFYDEADPCGVPGGGR